MKKTVILAAASLATTLAMGAPFQHKDVSGSARWVIHANLTALKPTEIGGLLVQHIKAGPAANQIAAMSAVLRFDPFKDLADITLYGASQAPADTVVLLGGTFDGPHLVTLLKANPGYTASSQGAHTIHAWLDEGKPETDRKFGCLHPSGKLLIGQSLAAVREAVAVLDGARSGLDAVKTFGAELPAANPFFVAGADLAGLGGRFQAQILNRAKSGWLTFREKAGQLTLDVVLNAADAAAATQIRDVAQGLIALGQMTQEQKPELAAILAGARLSLEDGQIRLVIQSAPAPVFKVIRDNLEKKAAPPAAHAPATL